MQAALPYLEEGVAAVERAVPYVYTAAAGLAGRQVYRDGLPIVTPEGESHRMAGGLRRSSRVKRTLFPKSPSRKKKRVRRTRTMAPSMGPTHHATVDGTARGFRTALTSSRYFYQLGRRPGRYATRRHTHSGSQTQPDQATYWSRLIQIPHNASTDVINARTANIVNLRGVKLRYWFRIEQATRANPLQVRWAIINPRENDGSDLTGNSTPFHFWIAKNPVSNQDDNFNSTGSCFDYMNRKINRKEYGVLREGQFVLDNTKRTDNNAFTMSAYKKLSMYIPIKRQMEFVNDTTSHPEQNLYFVWWYCEMGKSSSGQKYGGPSAAVTEHHEHTTYFTNSKMFA